VEFLSARARLHDFRVSTAGIWIAFATAHGLTLLPEMLRQPITVAGDNRTVQSGKTRQDFNVIRGIYADLRFLTRFEDLLHFSVCFCICEGLAVLRPPTPCIVLFLLKMAVHFYSLPTLDVLGL
jgi:hypothetical protein